MAVIDTVDVRGRILDVTAALVLEHGVAGVAQRQIAEQVGIKAASLYHHFGSKNEIVEAVFRRGIDVMEHAWDEAAAAATEPTRAPASLPTSEPISPHSSKTALHRCPRHCVPDGTGRSPQRSRADARRLRSPLDPPAQRPQPGRPARVAPTHPVRAMNSSVEWFDTERGNLDELAEVIAHSSGDARHEAHRISNRHRLGFVR